MFEYNGEEYSLAQVSAAASEANLALEEYIKRFGLKRVQLGKLTPTTPDAVVEETPASEELNTEFELVDTSSEFPEVEYIPDGFGGLKPKPIPSKVVEFAEGIPVLPETSEPASDEYMEEFERRAREDKMAAFERAIQEARKQPKQNNYINSLDNMIARISGFDDRLVLTTRAVANKIFGDEAVDKFVNNPNVADFWKVGLSDEEVEDAILEIKKIEAIASQKKVGDVFKGFKEGDLNEIASGIFNVLTSIGSSYAVSVPTAGAGLITDFFADSFYRQNSMRAKELGVDEIEFMNSDDADFYGPLVVGGLSGVSEKFGLRKMKEAIQQMNAGAIKKVAGRAYAALAEGGTETIQGFLQAAEEPLAKRKSAFEIASAMNDYVFSWEAVEDFALGMIGGGVVGTSFSANKQEATALVLGAAAAGSPESSAILAGGLSLIEIKKAASRLRNKSDIEAINKKTDEIFDLKKSLLSAKGKDVKNAINQSIKDKQEEIKAIIKKSNAKINLFAEDQLKTLANLPDLARKYQSILNDLQKKYRIDRTITKEEYDIARNVYKEQYLKERQRVDNTVKEVSKKNQNIAAKNKELINIIKDKNSTEIEVSKAKDDITKNNAGLINKTVNTLYNPTIQSGLTKEDVLSAVNEEFSKLIGTYKIDSGVEFGAYVQPLLLKRAPKYFDLVETTAEGEIIGKTDVTEQKGIASDFITQIEKEQNTAEANVIGEKLGFTSEQSIQIGKRILKGRLPGVTERVKGKQQGFLFAIRKAGEVALREDVLKSLGGQFNQKEAQLSEYVGLLDTLYKDLINNISNDAKNKRLSKLFNPVKTGRAKTAVGEDIFTYTTPTKEQFIKFFTEGAGYTTLRARKISLAETLAEVIGARGVREALQSDSNIEKEFSERQDLLDKDVPAGVGSRIINQIDTWIAQWDTLKPEPGDLRASFGLMELTHAAGKVFLQSLKVSVQGGMKFSTAVKKAVKDLKKYLSKENVSEIQQEAIVSSYENTTEKDFTKSTKVFVQEKAKNTEQTIAQRVEKNEIPRIENEIKEIFANKNLSNEQKLFDLQKIIDLNFTGLKNVLTKSAIGEKYNNNANLVKNLLKPNIPKEYHKSLNELIKNRYRPKVDFSNPATNIKKKLNSFDSNFKKSFKLLNELHQEDQIRNKRLILEKLENFKENKDLEGAGAFLESMRANQRAPLRVMFPLRIISLTKDNKLPRRLKVEHTPPINDAVNIMMQYIKGDINLNQLNESLDNFHVDLLDANLSKIYDKSTKSAMPKNHDFTKDAKDNRYNKEVQKELEKNNLEFFDLKENNELKDAVKEFDKIVTEATGIKENISEARIKNLAKANKRLRLLPPSADDFTGLLYYIAGKGKQGASNLEFFENNLLKPFAKAMFQFDAAKQQTVNQYRDLKKLVKKVTDEKGKKIKFKEINETGFTNEQAVRLYIWNSLGYNIKETDGKNIPEKDLNAAIKYINNNKPLLEFAKNIKKITALGYIEPDTNWTSGTLTTDLLSYVNKTARAKFLEPWQQNADALFSKENLKKLKGKFGENYVEALQDILYRMKTGRRRPFGKNKLTNALFNWVQDTVGTIMFLNSRSALLQQISFTNFINFDDNNPIAAGKALANTKQFSKDFAFLFNSNFLKQRRSGVKTDVASDEIAKVAEQGGNSLKAITSLLLKKGFILTQLGDSAAIALGGASFYRNRINTYKKQGLEQKEAEEAAFLDFQETAEETQQSARPDRVSQQQASPAGRIILNFGNVLMQYNRRAIKDIKDLVAKRPMKGKTLAQSNMQRVVRISYYYALQSIVFNTLQTAVFASFLDEDEDEERTQKRVIRTADQVTDGFLRGFGFGGAVISAGKNIILESINQYKSGRPNYDNAALEILSISPPISSKINKALSVGRKFTYKQSREKIFTEGISFDNPAIMAVGETSSVLFNIPADRVIRKLDNLSTPLRQETDYWQSIALALGYSKYDVNLVDPPKPKNKSDLKSKRLKPKKL
jgi:hypothetical protein